MRLRFVTRPTWPGRRLVVAAAVAVAAVAAVAIAVVAAGVAGLAAARVAAAAWGVRKDRWFLDPALLAGSGL